MVRKNQCGRRFISRTFGLGKVPTNHERRARWGIAEQGVSKAWAGVEWWAGSAEGGVGSEEWSCHSPNRERDGRSMSSDGEYRLVGTGRGFLEDMSEVEANRKKEEDFREECCMTVYGCKRMMVFVMASGGAHWWNLRVVKTTGGVRLEREDKDGVHFLRDEVGIFVFAQEGQEEAVILVGEGEVKETLQRAEDLGIECVTMDADWLSQSLAI